MQRYEEFSEVIKVTQGKRRYSTLYYPRFPLRSTDKYIIAKKSDRLDLIAYQEYGDTRYWVILAKANKLHSPTLRIPVGTRIRIPLPLNSDDIKEFFTEAQF